MLRWATILAVTAATALPVAAQFQADIGPEQMRQMMKAPAVLDLAVGEVGIMNFPRFCIEGTSVMVYARHGLGVQLSDYGVSFKVRREPGGSVSLTSQVGAKSSQTLQEAIGQSFIDPVPCGEIYGTDVIPVMSIDGKTQLSEIVVAQP
jgi:hypothetical protein